MISSPLFVFGSGSAVVLPALRSPINSMAGALKLAHTDGDEVYTAIEIDIL